MDAGKEKSKEEVKNVKFNKGWREKEKQRTVQSSSRGMTQRCTYTNAQAACEHTHTLPYTCVMPIQVGRKEREENMRRNKERQRRIKCTKSVRADESSGT